MVNYSQNSRFSKWQKIIILLVTGAGSGLLISMLEKLNYCCLTGLKTLVLLMSKSMGLLLRKNHFLRWWGWLFLLNWIGALSSIAKTASKEIRALIGSMKFISLSLPCISINLPCSYVWNTVVMSGLVLLVATWNCWISYKNGYTGLLALRLLPLLNPWLIVKMWPV